MYEETSHDKNSVPHFIFILVYEDENHSRMPLLLSLW